MNATQRQLVELRLETLGTPGNYLLPPDGDDAFYTVEVRPIQRDIDVVLVVRLGEHARVAAEFTALALALAKVDRDRVITLDDTTGAPRSFRVSSVLAFRPRLNL